MSSTPTVERYTTIELSEMSLDPTSTQTTFLGVSSGLYIFALDVGTSSLPCLSNVRLSLPSLTPSDVALSKSANGLMHWSRTSNYCTVCGGRTSITNGGHECYCPSCERSAFPRNDPAMISLVTNVERSKVVLAHSPRHPDNLYSCLAGFVDIGEGFEDAVKREVMEEVGVDVTGVRYVKTESWPFPQSFMGGFMAVGVERGEVVPQEEEILDARWFGREEVREASLRGSSQK